MTKKKYRRRQKLTKAAMQLRVVSVFLFLACVAVLFQVILLNRSLLSLADQMPLEGQELADRIPTVVFGNLLVTLGILFPTMLVAGILVTHKIAGPVYRLERYFEAIARGEDPGTIRFRDGDELHELAERINLAVAKLREKEGSPEPEVSEAA